MKNGINLQNINNLRKIHGFPDLIELPPIAYPDEVLGDSIDFSYEDLKDPEMEMSLFNSIVDYFKDDGRAHYEYIAFYPEWIRFFDSESIKGKGE